MEDEDSKVASSFAKLVVRIMQAQRFSPELAAALMPAAERCLGALNETVTKMPGETLTSPLVTLLTPCRRRLFRQRTSPPWCLFAGVESCASFHRVTWLRRTTGPRRLSRFSRLLAGSVPTRAQQSQLVCGTPTRRRLSTNASC